MDQITQTLEVRFEAVGLYPEQIPLSKLSRALSAVQRLSLGDEAAADDSEEAENAPLRLMDVHRGSAVFSCLSKTPQKTIENLRAAGQVLENAEDSDRIAYAFSPIEDLSAIARSLGCRIVVAEAGSNAGILARIEPDSYSKLAASLLISGDTTIAGRLERVGGTTEPRCALRVSFQHRLLYCKIRGSNDGEVIKRLAERLYDDVAVTGAARWLRSSWRIISFTVHDVHQPTKGKLTEMIGAVRAAGGDAWDKIDDPMAYMEEMSGEG